MSKNKGRNGGNRGGNLQTKYKGPTSIWVGFGRLLGLGALAMFIFVAISIARGGG